jgi:toxin ParE1/3/4
LNERSLSGALNVLRAIADAVGVIAAQPSSTRRTSDPDVRFFYAVENDFVEIIHVRHAARRPWL